MYDLVYKLLYTFILTINISVILYNVNSIQPRKKGLYVFTIVTYLISYILYTCGCDDFLRVAIIIFITAYIYFEYGRIYYSMIIAALTIIIYALSDLTVGFFEIMILNVNRAEIVNNPKLYLITMILILINSFLISKFFKRFTKNKDIYLKKYLKYMIILLSYLIVVVIFIIIFVSIYNKQPQVGNTIIILYSLFVLYSFVMTVILMFICHNNIRKELEKEYKEKEDAQFKEYTVKLEGVTCDLRKFRHDYLNILKTLGGYIESEDINSLKRYYNDIVSESEVVLNKEDKSFMLLQYVKIDPLKSLIAAKIINAQSLGIKTYIEITEEIDKLSMKVIDICRIIGNILDNAIEASVESDEKIIRFAIIKSENNVIFIIKNSCTKDTPPIYKIYEKNFSTKGVGRGLGLKSVREIISEKYSSNVILNTKISGMNFTQELITNNNIKNQY